MRFSVIMPAHNAGRWIGEALESVAAQTVAADEVIVIADSCTDDTIERARGFVELPIKVIACECRNAAATRNLGIREARGAFVAMLDADDVWLPNHLASALALLADSDDVAYMSGFERMLPDGASLKTVTAALDRPRSGLDHLTYIEMIENEGLTFGHLTVVYRRERLMEPRDAGQGVGQGEDRDEDGGGGVGGFDASFLSRHDFELWLRVIAGRTWSCDPEPTARYRVDTPGSITSNLPRGTYFGLKGLVRHASDYPSDTYRAMLVMAARRAMSTALVDGTAEDYRIAKELAWPHLPLKYRLLFGVFGRRAGLLAAAMRWRRSWIKR